MKKPENMVVLLVERAGGHSPIATVLREHEIGMMRCGTLAEAVDIIAADNELGSCSVADAILLDLDLPDSVGMAALRAVLRHAHGTPVIVLADNDHIDLARQAISAGAADWMIKGEVNGNLVRAIDFAATRRRARRDSESELTRYIQERFEPVLNQLAVL